MKTKRKGRMVLLTGTREYMEVAKLTITLDFPEKVERALQRLECLRKIMIEQTAGRESKVVIWKVNCCSAYESRFDHEEDMIVITIIV